MSLALYLCAHYSSPSLPFPIPTLVGQQLTLPFRFSLQLVCCSLFFHNACDTPAVVDYKVLRESLQTLNVLQHGSLTLERVVSENNTQLGHALVLYLLLHPLLCPRHSSVLSLHR
jgi:hypothetical protein